MAMAPALTSEAALDNKLEQAARPSQSSGRQQLKCTSDLDSTVAVLKKRIQSNSPGSVISRQMVRNGRRRKSKKSLSVGSSLSTEGEASRVDDRIILGAPKTMNPGNGSSLKNVTDRTSVTDASVRRFRNTAMCGTDKKSSGHWKMPQLTNGDNKMFIKKSQEPSKTPAEVVEQASISPLQNLVCTPDNVDDNFENATYRHARLSARATVLENRVRRLQARQAVCHTRQQIGGFVDNQKRLLEQQVIQREATDATLDLKDAQNMSTSALVHLVQKWQAQQPLSRRHPKQDGHNIVRLDDEVCAELDQLSGHLTSNAQHIENAIDSDATESSSGGESCDEGDFDYDWGEKVKPSLHKRVDWRWAKDRCDIASRWTWLQAQVSDLEYRIRQQSEIYKQIRQKKGEVKLGESTVAGRDTRLDLVHQSNMYPAAVTPLLSNIDQQSASLQKQLGNIYTPSPKQSPAPTGVATRDAESATPNGLVSQTSLATHSSECSSSDSTPATKDSPSLQTALDPTNVAARCRPTILGKYRKRKLLRTSSLHTRSRKCARLSNVKCQCYPPVTPCAMCGGRYNNVKDVDQENCPVPEKIALLDHSYHQVLSLEEDVPLSLHFDSLLKTGEWQQHLQTKSHAGQFSVEKRRGQYQIKEKRKFVKKTASLEVLSRIKNKYAAERVYSTLPLSPQKKRLSRICDIRMRKKKAALQDVLRKERKLARSRRDGGVMYGDDSSTLREIKEHIRRKRTESAYDINNIVIPYSIAASTRVEKLQYKEILTPSWREVESNGMKSPTAKCRKRSASSDKPLRETNGEKSAVPAVIEQSGDQKMTCDDEFEDVSDEAVRSRHERSEEEEKRKFLSYTTGGSQQQKRHRTRPSESAAPVGVMTPDPSSPDLSDTHTQATPPTVPAGSQAWLAEEEGPYRRPRAASLSSSLSRGDALRSCSEDNSRGWPRRAFPLSDAEFKQLFMERPPDVKYELRASRAVHVPRTSVSKDMLLYEDSSALDSPPQSPTSSASTGADDDKEWTVKSVNSRHSSLILKIAKR